MEDLKKNTVYVWRHGDHNIDNIDSADSNIQSFMKTAGMDPEKCTVKIIQQHIDVTLGQLTGRSQRSIMSSKSREEVEAEKKAMAKTILKNESKAKAKVNAKWIKDSVKKSSSRPQRCRTTR